eukprot:COSAG05_NODE_1054_length_6012_cov_63.809572_4_plen_65_part_00
MQYRTELTQGLETSYNLGERSFVFEQGQRFFSVALRGVLEQVDVESGRTKRVRRRSDGAHAWAR